MSTTTFLVSDFDDKMPNKINNNVSVESKNSLSVTSAPLPLPAIATNGFPLNKDGVYVYVTRIDNIGSGHLFVGFTDKATYDSTKSGAPGDEWAGHGFSGTSLFCFYGKRYPGRVHYLDRNITADSKEIISILTISNNGTKKEVQWIVDGNEGPVQDCMNDKKGFGNGDEIFPCLSLRSDDQQVTTIPFDQVKSRSPKIEQLLKEYSSNHQSQAANNINQNREQQNDNDDSALVITQQVHLREQQRRQEGQQLELVIFDSNSSLGNINNNNNNNNNNDNNPLGFQDREPNNV